MLKLDLHTHSQASRDGGIRPNQYRRLLERGVLDYIAVTDHNRIDAALALQQELGERIIVGEEINAQEGEIIGLFLRKPVPAGLSAEQTARAIKEQDGLVYIPHPFETVRKGLSHAALDAIAAHVDIVEVANGRALLQNRGPQAIAWAGAHHKAVAGSSDAHGIRGVGFTYTEVSQPPTRQTFLQVLRAGKPMFGHPPIHTLLYPKLNRARKRLLRHHDD